MIPVHKAIIDRSVSIERSGTVRTPLEHHYVSSVFCRPLRYGGVEGRLTKGLQKTERNLVIMSLTILWSKICTCTKKPASESDHLTYPPGLPGQPRVGRRLGRPAGFLKCVVESWHKLTL
jgi:hypothetical protein